MSLEYIVQGQIHQSPKGKCCMIPLTMKYLEYPKTWRTESGMKAARAWEMGNGELLLNEYKVSI